MPQSQLPIYDLGPEFYDEVSPANFPSCQLRFRNDYALNRVGLDEWQDEDLKRHLCRFEALPQNLAKPLALRYHGHQFLNYNPRLGDGRGFLFAQFQTERQLLEFGTKGSGQTPYSRDGDGRLTLKGAFREALATELLESLGVHTSQTVAFFETGEDLVRHDEPSPTRSAVLTRLCRGHVRFGSFQRLAYFRKTEDIKKLVRYSIKHFYPGLIQKPIEKLHKALHDEEQVVRQFFGAVVERQASLVASFMMAGFVHGVLNTDNMNVSGESFDYGPYRFLQHYDAEFTAAYFDSQGLYAYGRQPMIFSWNLAQLAACLNLAYPNLQFKEELEKFADDFNSFAQKYFLQRMNVRKPSDDTTGDLLQTFFQVAENKTVPFEQLFFDLQSGAVETRLQKSPYREFYQGPEAQELISQLRHLDVDNPEWLEHPYFQGEKPVTLLIEEIEGLWAPIAEKDNWDPFHAKIRDIRSFRGLYHLVTKSWAT